MSDSGVRPLFKALLRADFLVTMRNRRAVLLSVLLPILLLFATNTNRAEQRLDGSTFIVGLCITYGLVSTSIMGYALTVARDREKGVFQRLRVTPAPTWTIMVSRLVMRIVANLVIAIVVVIVGAQIHHLSLSAGEYALVLVVSVLGGAVFLAIGQALVGLVRSADSVNAAGRVLYIGLVFLGLLGLEGVLGDTIQSIAKWSPVGAVMTLFAGVLDLSAWSSTDTLSIVACLGYVVACTVVGIRWFQWEAR